ncbi:MULTISPECIES: cyclic nucleotide-binding domain-containing protein [unclassified Tolypothrix]|uniref:cyclic nucleotide-binding domain-containing protein n=1 Tax=unclassified Tolypothrix TaxID=2649714 RepID=UPI0005EAB0F1|nr:MULTISPECIES: cyclic nucleotide-binding domain-containing protein [unclassified Tolypothrix]BAY91188.1 cyclic nucleotide-binding protein [Microchaete diplosiphon NIES-3275]EKE99881.1 cyclic nucleotide-binding domain protein [Tolypothrix sp. PCC 7601]MBE9085593.1 cyclic nucleotide-binding domain-containing protein [Tolypothrix sp. LEGE 11397]UYD25271.1 cyclic nucleotide-binding domain-containing protein [Tolypothrix sp. PCC 7712]UYD32489.1 cyclic nucleotide-binding domain-containing protein 
MSILSNSEVTTVKQLLANFPHFRVLQDQDFDCLNSVVQQKTYPSGTVLIEEGKPTTSIYVCLSGNLAMVQSQQDGSKQQLTTFSNGELVGETSFLDNQVAATTIIVTEPSELLVFPKQKLIDCIELSADFAARFYHLLAINLSDRLRKLTKLMATQNIKEGEPLRKVLIVFATLNDSDIAWMVANGVATKAGLGSALIQQEQTVPAVYLLLEGMLGIYVNINNNGAVQEKEVAKRVKGDILGEMSFVDGGVASASVKTLENAWVLALPQTTLAAKFHEDRGFAGRFYRSLVLILSNRCLDLLLRAGITNTHSERMELLSEDIEVEDELDFDVLEGTAIAGKRFDWMIQQLRR